MLISTSSLQIALSFFSYMNNRQRLYNQGSIKFKLCMINNCKYQQKNEQKTYKQALQHKGIGKKNQLKCSKTCKSHKFKLTKIEQDTVSSSFYSFRYDVCHNYCFTFNYLLKRNEGGLPTFNNDKRIETPAFSLKAEQMLDAKDNMYKQRFKDVLAKATDESGYFKGGACKGKGVISERSQIVLQLIKQLKKKKQWLVLR